MGRPPLVPDREQRHSRAVEHWDWGSKMLSTAGRRTFPAVTAATFLAVATLVALVGPAALGSTAAAGRPDRSAPSALPTRAAAALPTLVGIRAFHRPGLRPGRLRVRRRPAGAPDRAYVDRLISDGRGLPLRIAGRAILQVSWSSRTPTTRPAPRRPGGWRSRCPTS